MWRNWQCIVEEVSEFVYLGSKITADGDTASDVENRIAKARAAFASLRKIWKSSVISTNTKIRIFKSNVNGVLLHKNVYGTESWKVLSKVFSTDWMSSRPNAYDGFWRYSGPTPSATKIYILERHITNIWDDQDETMEMDQTCPQDGSNDRHEMDTSRQEK